MRTFPAVFALFLVGCTVEEEDFPDAYGRTVCSRIRECQRSDYEERYDDRSACVDEWSEFADNMIDLADTFGGEYSPEGGQDCLENIHEATCEEFSGNQYTCDIME